jgi:thioredoxin-related protein
MQTTWSINNGESILMKSWLFLFSLFALLSSSLYAAEPEDRLSAGMVNPGYHEKPSWFKDSFLDIREDIEEASAEGRRVLLYFYQDGCPYCGKLLQDNFSDREIAGFSQQYFDVISINMWGDREVFNVNGSLRLPWFTWMKQEVTCYVSMAILRRTGSSRH